MGTPIDETIDAVEELQWLADAESGDISTAAVPAMDALPLAHREVLMLWNGGMNYGEIAARTGRPSETVAILLIEARDQLIAAYDFAAG